jgi:diacylglycerol kinase (ATP)
MRVAVVANATKSLGGGLPELRRVLEEEGVEDPLWYEVAKSKKAPEAVERALQEGAEQIFAWGGDGLVRRCVNVLAGTDVPLAIIPAGTSNLCARNLGLDIDLRAAVDVGLRGARRRIDVGCFNGERFAVMAGAGFDAAMIKGADDRKDRLGRAAYVLSGAANLDSEPFEATIAVDGMEWFSGRASCILFGNMGSLFGGVVVYDAAEPDDGLLDLGVVTADGRFEMARTVLRTVAGSAHASPFVRVTKCRSVTAELDRKVRYELDGGDRKKVKSFTVDVEPRAVIACVPQAA